MRDVFVATLSELAAADPRITLVTGDLGFGVLTEFARRFPRQYLNAGVAEQNMTGLAAGMAIEGRTVFTYSIGNFPTLRCLEQIRSDVCYHGANVKIVSIGGGFSYGALGISHHATEDLAIMRALPGLAVAAPGDLWETAGITRHLAVTPGPAYLRLDKSIAPPTHMENEVFQFGRARVVRAGSDVTLIAIGGILGEALHAAEELDAHDYRCRVISMSTLWPFDGGVIELAARETGGLITVEEHAVGGGLGGAVAEHLLEAGVIPRFFRRLGVRGGFPELYGSQQYLRHHCGLDAEAISAAARAAVEGRELSCPT